MKTHTLSLVSLPAILFALGACGIDSTPSTSEGVPTSDPLPCGPDVPGGADAGVDDPEEPPVTDPGGLRFAQVGFSTVGGDTTGGAGGATVSVTTLAELSAEAATTGPRIIQITARITGNTSVVVTSDKTIVGLGPAAELVGVGLRLKAGTSNVVFRNLKISKVVAEAGDAIAIQGPGTHHVWVDHCDLSSDLEHGKDFYDGLLDITHAADAITVSWNVFHEHFKVSLVGHSDNNAAEDIGQLHVTYHHNQFVNVSSRAPSLRFGTLHAFNNLSQDFVDASTGVSSRDGACARVERNVFENVETPVLVDQSDLAGLVQLIDDDFGGAALAIDAAGCDLAPPYAFAQVLDATDAVAEVVRAGAGVGKLADPTQL